MQSVDITQFRADVDSVISAAQREDVCVLQEGRVVAVVSKPVACRDFEAYWLERERLLADVAIDPRWDSTEAISQDRDRA